MNNNRNIIINKNYENKFFPVLSMISITLLISAMIFTYRIIEIGPFLTPGGVIPFALTYLIAGIITETYGYENARKMIFGNFICIFIFNFTVSLLLKLPISGASDYAYYNKIFDNALYIMLIYSLGFFFGDLINAFFISKWSRLLKGRFFFFRLIGASLIGQITFSTIVIPALYITQLPPNRLFQQFLTTITSKLLIIIIFSYPSIFITKILKRIEQIDPEEPKVAFNPFFLNTNS